MRTLDEILAISAERKGGEAPIFEGFQPSKAPDQLRAIPDDRWIAGMTRAIFQAGFNWKVVDATWPGFEAAFNGLDIGRNAMMSDDRFDAPARTRPLCATRKKFAPFRKTPSLFRRLHPITTASVE